MKNQIQKQKDLLNKLYIELGKITFKKNENTKNSLISLNKINYIKSEQKLCDKINETKKNIYNLQKQSRLELKQHAPEPVLNEEGYGLYKFCPKCLVGNNPNATECIYCGEKFNN